MSKLEVLCVTMHQKDFSKIKGMNIHTDVVFANQADTNEFAQCEFEGHRAKMVTTATRGVGNNRNIALLYATGEYCILADDDVVYDDDMPQRVISEFEAHPDADVMIFHLDSDDPKRKLEKYPRTQKCSRFGAMPWGGVRIAFKLASVRKANAWFTTLFGGGAVFPSGEDSMFLTDLRNAGLRFYVSKETIGKVSFATSTWYTGVDERYYYGKGAFYQAVRPKFKYFWMLYLALKTYRRSNMKFADALKWMHNGAVGYTKLVSYNDFVELINR